jgi:hypothetical protein
VAYTQADIDALDEEIRKVRLVKATEFADQRTEFRPLDELMKLRATMAQSLAQVNRVRLAATSKGV